MKEKIVRFPDDKCPYCSAYLDWGLVFSSGITEPTRWGCTECSNGFLAVPADYEENQMRVRAILCSLSDRI